MIGRLRDAALAANPASIIAVVSDHGFARTDFRTNPYGPILHAGLPTAGDPGPLGTPTFSSWKATLWRAGGSAAVMLRGPEDTASLNTTMKLLQDLATDAANGIHRILTCDELHQFGGFPEAKALVVLRPPYQLGYAFSGLIVIPAPSTAMHGYLPSNPDMRSSFFIMGRGIAGAHKSGPHRHPSDRSNLATLLCLRFPGSNAVPVRLR